MAEHSERLVEVTGHWLPRMEAAGIPSATAKAVVERTGTWDRWCATWSAEAERHIGLGEAAEAAGHGITAGEAYARASLFYHFANFMFFDDLEQKTRANEAKIAVYRRAAPLLSPPAARAEIPFEGGHLSGYLRRPGAGEAGAVLLIPGSDSTKEEFPALEEVFLKRGLATFSLDGPGQGEGRSAGPLRADIATAVEAALGYLDGVGIARAKVVLVGMAFGGHLAIRAGATVGGLAGIVSINGFHDLGAMIGSFPSVYRDNMGFALGGTSAAETVERARAFTLDGSPPPDCPILLFHGGLDRIFPPEEAEKTRAWAGRRADVRILADGNHVCNNVPWAYRPATADWARDAVLAG